MREDTGEDCEKTSQKDVPASASRRRHARPLELDSEGEEDEQEEDSGKVEDHPAVSDKEDETERMDMGSFAKVREKKTLAVQFNFQCIFCARVI